MRREDFDNEQLFGRFELGSEFVSKRECYVDGSGPCVYEVFKEVGSNQYYQRDKHLPRYRKIYTVEPVGDWKSFEEQS